MPVYPSSPVRPWILGIVCFALTIPAAKAASSAAPVVTLPIPTAQQINAIAALLPANPVGVGRPITDRAAWGTAMQQHYFQKQVQDAKTYASQPIPVLTQEMGDAYFKTGRRDVFEVPFHQRTKRLNAFVIAECGGNDGKYLALIEAELNAILKERSWVEPYHASNKSAEDADRNRYTIDLAAAARAWSVATADYWLGDKLKPATRALIRTELRTRIFDPYEASVKSGVPKLTWMTANHNWNPVCTAGVMGAALTILDSPQERALFVQAAENSMPYYVNGLGTDGYCYEGSGYWNYGYGNYLCLAEVLYDQTQGRINLFQGDRLRAVALYMKRLEILPGVFPAFGDAWHSMRGTLAPEELMQLINQRWGMGWSDLDPTKSTMYAVHPLGDRLFGFGIFGFPLPAYGGSLVAGSPATPEEAATSKLRHFFKDASVLVTRSQRPGAPDLGLAFKGGDCGHNHGHNDSGTYVVATKGMALVVDPGMEVYTRDSFSSHRYDVGIMNSYGHDVPYIGKTLQKGGKTALGQITNTSFTDDRDTVTMDLTTSYNVPSLIKVTRTYVLDRTRPAVEITDTADFSKPTDYGCALITGSKWKENGPGSFLIYDQDSAVQATVTLEGTGQSLVNKVEPVTAHQLPPNYHPMRLGFNLNAPVTHVVTHTLIVPVPAPSQ